MTMKFRLSALMLVVVMLMSCAGISHAETADDPVLVTINGEAYTQSHVEYMMQMLYEYGYATSETDYYNTLEYLLYAGAEGSKLSELGLDEFTEEEKAAFAEEAQMEMESMIDEWITYYASGAETEEELEELRNSVVDYFAQSGYTVQVIEEELMYNASFDRLVEYIKENHDISVTDEEVKAYFEEGVELDRQEYENDVAKYEMYTTYYGVESWYIPSGYRGVLQILLEVDEELLNDYLAKKDAYEMSLTSTEENVLEEETDPVTLEDVQLAYNAAMSSCQDTIEEIYARLENGEAFIDLIPEYNIDPGMQNEEMLRDGYMAHPDSYMDEAFLDAVFSEKMQKPGDVSDPSLGMYGIYITYYLREVPSGAVELTDELYSSILNILENEKFNALYNSMIEEWANACVVEYNEEILLEIAGLTFVDGKLVAPAADEEVPEQE
ncbi:MAG: hypothetical protein IKT57_06225 [Clostridia bacterium]|nr:hypothetical protein [Clostridia bacterium]